MIAKEKGKNFCDVEHEGNERILKFKGMKDFKNLDIFQKYLSRFWSMRQKRKRKESLH